MNVLSDRYWRVIRFRETDAAGVVYFGELLGFCHEAYEDALAKAGVDIRSFFSKDGCSKDGCSKDGVAEAADNKEGLRQLAIAIPIVHTEADFFRPMFCGDRIAISLLPKQLAPHSFEIAYEVFSEDEQKIAKASTRHVAIQVDNRRRCPLPSYLIDWIASFDEY